MRRPTCEAAAELVGRVEPRTEHALTRFLYFFLPGPTRPHRLSQQNKTHCRGQLPITHDATGSEGPCHPTERKRPCNPSGPPRGQGCRHSCNSPTDRRVARGCRISGQTSVVHHVALPSPRDLLRVGPARRRAHRLLARVRSLMAWLPTPGVQQFDLPVYFTESLTYTCSDTTTISLMCETSIKCKYINRTTSYFSLAQG